ncbi:hypothetical protein JW721_01955 [Candidatus Micrarchaeota archaeon]|nr:hypothetical protein [Candidatus Micrarchaeota archaeon]
MVGFGENMQIEGRMVQLNPLSLVPEKVISARQECLVAFKEARRAFADHIGPEFEKALSKVEGSDFEISTDSGGHTIITRLSSGEILSLNVDETGIVLSLAKKDGKEDTVIYREGEISRRRRV